MDSVLRNQASTADAITFPFSEPPKVYHDRSSKCLGCPYPRHGLMCWSKDDGSCLRTDMQALEADRFDKKSIQPAGKQEGDA